MTNCYSGSHFFHSNAHSNDCLQFESAHGKSRFCCNFSPGTPPCLYIDCNTKNVNRWQLSTAVAFFNNTFHSFARLFLCRFWKYFSSVSSKCQEQVQSLVNVSFRENQRSERARKSPRCIYDKVVNLLMTISASACKEM